MPIYAYKCESCGFVKDVLQKMSDPVLEVCPSCGQPAFKKQLTAAGFQLKGSGWYATDFKGGGAAQAKTESASPAPAAASNSNAPSAPAAAPAVASTPAAPAA
jgi:putative FmdB family regulatory protein